MPEFKYTAANAQGKKIEGQMQADNEGELRMALRSQGLRPVRISKAKITEVDLGTTMKGFMGTSNDVPMDKLMNFIRQLQVMLSSGVPIVQAIELFHEQEGHPALKKILGNTSEKLKSGGFLWQALNDYPDVFERVFVSLIRAGESSGSLDVMLKRVGKYMENAWRMKKLIKSSMTYPIAVVTIAIVIVAGMLGFVIPKFEEMIVGNGGELPGPTKFVIWLSNSFRDHFVIIAGITTAVILATRSYLRTPEGKIVAQKSLMNIGVARDFIVKSGTAQFCRTLSTLLASGVPLVDSLEICRTAAAHIVFQDAITLIKKDVEVGASLASAMMKVKIFPKMATQMASVGENTGNMDKMLEKVAEFFEEEMESAIAGMMKLIEPMMLVVLGGIVGGLMISMYLPVFQMAGSGAS